MGCLLSREGKWCALSCCGSSSTYGILPEEIGSAIAGLRSKFGCDVLIMGVKDQNTPGKLCFCGDVGSDLAEAVLKVLTSHKGNENVIVEKDKYDMMWDVVYRNTKITTGHSTFSFTKGYFPDGKLFVKLLDCIASFGWALKACPNFGGVESRDDNGNVTSCVDWPIFIFYKEKDSLYTPEHLMLAVKDSNMPGKLCAAGPVGDLEGQLTSVLQGFTKKVESKKDAYDDDYDVVWRNTEITTGFVITSFAKSYFPRGKTNVALLECAYSFGWRAVAAPNWGGSGDSWPSVIFRKVKDAGASAPEVLFASVKDSNIPGKLCFAGRSAQKVTTSVGNALRVSVEGNDEVKAEKDCYDDDYDDVCRNVKITNGLAAFSFKLPYFPRCDSMTTFLNTLAQEGFQVVACPNFGGMKDSWPSFIFEKRRSVPVQMYLAIKDENYPGKLCLGGSGIDTDPGMASELLHILTTLCGPSVQQAKDDYDKTFDYCFKNTVVTTGHATFTWSKCYWPHGYVVEQIIQVLFKHGWRAEGGPNFGDDGLSWPSIIFTKMHYEK